MEKLISACGLNCADCDAYKATIDNDEAAREEVAKKWSEIYGANCTPMDCICEGCMQDGLLSTAHATTCALRSCAVEKEIKNCSECDEFACDQLEEFFTYVPDAREVLEKLREKGK